MSFLKVRSHPSEPRPGQHPWVTSPSHSQPSIQSNVAAMDSPLPTQASLGDHRAMIRSMPEELETMKSSFTSRRYSTVRSYGEVTSDGGERIVVPKTTIEGLEDVEEERDGLACIVCQEEYTLRPTDMLGVYPYSKHVNLGVGTLRSACGECVCTTVSPFNIIHFQ